MMKSTLAQYAIFAVLLLFTHAADVSAQRWKIGKILPSAEAHQAAAADQDFLYAITNQQVAKYDRTSNRLIDKSKGKAFHLNSGFFREGRLYCAHSDTTFYYKDLPDRKHMSERSQIKVLDVTTMKLKTFKDLGDRGGSLTWSVFHRNHWWCNFARYRKGNRSTFLAKFAVEKNGEWREQARWLYPDHVLDHLGTNSISGGVWRANELLVTGHDEDVLYRLKLPDAGNTLVYLGKYNVPFTGQGIAFDPKTGGMVGIVRGRRSPLLSGSNQIVVALPPQLPESKPQEGDAPSDQGARK